MVRLPMLLCVQLVWDSMPAGRCGWLAGGMVCSGGGIGGSGGGIGCSGGEDFRALAGSC